MTAEHEVRALLAEHYAELVDRAKADENDAALLRAGDKLTELLDTLPIRATSAGGGTSDSPGDERARVVRLIDGPPQVGDAAHS